MRDGERGESVEAARGFGMTNRPPSFSLDCLTLPDVAPVDLIRVAAEVGYGSFSLWVQPPAMYDVMLATSAMTADLARAIETLLDDPQYRKRLGDCARASVIDEFSWQAHTERIVNRLRVLCE